MIDVKQTAATPDHDRRFGLTGKGDETALPGLGRRKRHRKPRAGTVSAALPSARKWQCCMGAISWP
jgi:hypothetical protein